ncbi:hypothetical protein BGLA2_180065 [Burkholderia gladioli]|nr:hypothetical protein BGLA2_180065 [Burkholderia gladioli]
MACSRRARRDGDGAAAILALAAARPEEPVRRHLVRPALSAAAAAQAVPACEGSDPARLRRHVFDAAS